ncbi:MAG: nucleoside recognition protein [Acidobacteria bacterium]|nr:MAG: nucleoside recognition protein [Acidobacteriota bacterium]
MLNWVWLAMIALGIGIAVTTDVIDQGTNKYRNGDPLSVEFHLKEPYDSAKVHSYQAELTVSDDAFNEFYKTDIEGDVSESVKLTVHPEKEKVTLFFKVDDATPEFWREMAVISGKDDDLMGQVTITSVDSPTRLKGDLILEDIKFARMKEVTNSALDYAGIAVDIALGLIGIMALWLGVMKVAEEAGLIKVIAKAVRPVTRFLFPDVPHDHPAMGAIIMNISANMLGLGNAATPFGLKAMEELNTLNPDKTTATNAMVTFLAVNTAGLTMIPATAIAIRAAAGSSDPAIIIGTSIFGALCASIVGITAAKTLEKFPMSFTQVIAWFKANFIKFVILIAIFFVMALLFMTGVMSVFSFIFDILTPETFKSVITVISILAIPGLISVFLIYGAVKKIKVYEKFVEGAKEGFDIAVRIIPYLVAMLVAIGIFRAGGAMEVLILIMQPLTDFIGMPAEALPMALMRPLSGSGSLGIMAEIMATHGPDSFIGILTSTFFGSTETTFYVLAVYFGSVNIQKTRHALAAGLLADTAGILGALFIVKLLFGA